MGFISYEESIQILQELEVQSKGRENLALTQSLGRIIAEDIVALENSPIFPTSAMDGYAILGVDQELGRIELIPNDNPAGTDIEIEVTPGLALKTFTGSLMPKGADTLTPIENVTVDGNSIIINETVPAGFSVRPVGESFKAGEVLISRGTKIGYAEIGVMASLGLVMIPLVVEPKVAILATGSEVLDLGECSTNPAQIRSSNNYTLAALSEQHGAKAVQMGVVSDAYASIKNEMTQALENADIVVTTGGVSVGDYDFVKDIIPELGAKVIYQGVKIKPGQHVMVAQKGTKFIVGLPGFAFSSTVTFLLYVVPLIEKLKGRSYQPKIVNATLKESFSKRSKKSEFTPCNLRLHEGRYEVDFKGKKNGSSAILTNMLGATALLMSKEDDSTFDKGSDVKVMVIS